ncbi:uncharacterized protein [Aquarana catesbeiana]|uniref:uncharacterized protein n=1 Tax=Aquarana catesbeiana TaxID=8400 RepID=UPI003CC9333B
MRTIDFDGAPIQLYPDLSWITLQQRRSLQPLLTTLKEHDFRYHWGFPFSLTAKKDERSTTLRYPEDLHSFCKDLDIPVPPTPRQDMYIDSNSMLRLLSELGSPLEMTTAPYYVLPYHHGTKHITPKDIVDQFGSYYSKLYNLTSTSSALPPSSSDIDDFLTNLHLPTLSQEQILQLSSPFSPLEVAAAINVLPLHKAPGPDGFNNEYYKTFSDLLTPYLCHSFNSIANTGCIPPESIQAAIVTIPKPGKPTDQPASYRPISLLNTDTKLFAKLLATRLSDIKAQLIHIDQLIPLYICTYDIELQRPSSGSEAGRVLTFNQEPANSVPSLSMEVSEDMEALITKKGLDMALDTSKSGKATGLDGLTVNYYKTFRDALFLYFKRGYNSTSPEHGLPVGTLRAHITIIPKLDKDYIQCGNYQPIATLNVDLKLFTNILENRLLPHISQLVHDDQRSNAGDSPTYVTCHPNPSDQAAQILQRLTCDPLCLQAFIRTGSICTLRARLLLQESPDGDEKERSRHPKRARKLGDILMRNLCIQAASSFGVGLVSHMLVSGPQNDRQQCALCLPFIYRKDSPHRQNLLDGAIRLVLESLMISVDPVYYFHVSECLSSILTPQTSERRSFLPTPQASACRSSILTPQTSERRSSLPTPQASACRSPILIPQTSECRSSLLTPKALECPSSISTPQALECPSSISTPQALEFPSSISTPQDSPAPPKSSSPTSFTCCYLKLFSQGQGDIVFVLDGGERLEGSRELICKSSDVFHAMLQGGYAESQQCEVRVREIPVSAFLPLLHYLHGCSQDSLCPTLKSLQQLEPEQELVQSPLSSTLAAAGQFLLPGLQYVLENLVRDSLLTLDRLPSVYNFAEMHECAQLRRDCCMYLLKRLHPPQRRARTLFQLCEQAQDKQKLTRHLEDVLQRRD